MPWNTQMIAKAEKKGRALVSGAMLKWARESTRLDIETAAKVAGVSNPETLRAAENGEGSISLRQLVALARSCRIPLRMFYLVEPPSKEHFPVDFRSAKHDEFYSADVIKLLRTARLRRDAAIDLFQEAGLSREALAKLEDDESIIKEIYPVVRATTWESQGITVPSAADDGTKSLSLTKELIERRFPILVFESSAEQFRGCSLYDDSLSVIILSSGDSANAKRFTLAHELAHLFLRESGICTPFQARIDDEVERRCNRIAGEALAPKAEVEALVEAWSGKIGMDAIIVRLGRRFRLSQSAIAVRLGQLGTLSADVVREKLEFYRQMWQAKKTQESESVGGPHAHLIQAHRLGPTYSHVVLEGMDNDALSVTQAAGLLGVSPSYASISSLREKLLSVYGQ